MYSSYPSKKWPTSRLVGNSLSGVVSREEKTCRMCLGFCAAPSADIITGGTSAEWADVDPDPLLIGSIVIAADSGSSSSFQSISALTSAESSSPLVLAFLRTESSWMACLFLSSLLCCASSIARCLACGVCLAESFGLDPHRSCRYTVRDGHGVQSRRRWCPLCSLIGAISRYMSFCWQLEQLHVHGPAPVDDWLTYLLKRATLSCLNSADVMRLHRSCEHTACNDWVHASDKTSFAL
ncbi:hypothetical protein F5H01DRAFT_319098 [Linnemannia elongata]|nr:hypothetical protein F5H01DRAFT_319098 [Linnemannia elongata]